jgi:hypothetical protein
VTGSRVDRCSSWPRSSTRSPTRRCELDLAFIALFLLVSILMQINRVVFYY